MTYGAGSSLRPLTTEETADVFRKGLESADLCGRHVLVVLPDATRTAPVAECFRMLTDAICGHVASLKVLIALGTHPPMSETELEMHLGLGQAERLKAGVEVHNHTWDRHQALIKIGTLSESEIARMSGGLLSEAVPVEINRLAIEAERIIIIGPVFPHEVVGFSGGYKYFFPGISGPAVLHASHWLGALITNPKINGTRWTPVREMIHRAASMVGVPTTVFALVMRGHALHGIYAGDPIQAWESAASLSAEVNIVWVPHSYETVLSIAPAMYRDLWTAGKCVYKVEPIVADGGRVIVYAPHIRDLSPTHGMVIRSIGYHTRDYFLNEWERFRKLPRAVLAHSSHVRGIGTCVNGVEHDRMDVMLASAIPERECREVNLSYLDPAVIGVQDYLSRATDDTLVVPEAGEVLYRLADGSVPDVDQL